MFWDAVLAIGSDAVSAIGSVLLEHAQLLLGFALAFVAAALAFVATLYHDWRRKRADERKLANALVYQIRRALENLKELAQAMKQGPVIYSSGFSDSLWKQSERDVADLSADVYILIDAFFAQLRNTDYLRDEFKGWNDKVLANEEDAPTSRVQCGNTLRMCVNTAIDYGNEALKALEPFARSGAFTAPLPPRFYTEKEKQILGK